jgi:hypothetical protein
MARKKSTTPVLLVGHVKGDPADLPPGILYHPGRSPDAPRRVSAEVQVSDDPALIAWLRQACEADLAARFAGVLRTVEAGQNIYLEHRHACRQRGPAAIEAIRSVMHSTTHTPKSRTWAALLLAELGQDEGRAFLLAALTSGDLELSQESLERLGHYSRSVQLTDPDVAPLVLACLRSPHPVIADKAVHLCRFQTVPGAEAALREKLQTATAHRRDISEALARLATTPASIEAALPDLLPPRGDRYTSRFVAMFTTTLKGDEAVAGPLRRVMRDYLLGYEGPVRLGQHWACDFGMVAGPGDEPILEDILASATDPVSRAGALQALARLHPDTAVERTLAEITKYHPWEQLLGVLAQYATERDADRICAVLYPSKPDAKPRPINRTEAKLLEEKLGNPGRQRLNALLDRLDPHARQWIEWKRAGLHVRNAVAELRAAGILPPATEDPTDPPATQDENPRAIVYALGGANLTTYFDTETGFIPCRHDRLIEDFAAGSAGGFVPECVLQLWPRQNEDDFDSPYIVLFLHAGRVYRFGVENHGDYYDVEGVVNALNFALEQTGRPERYIALHTGDQAASFVFADPARFVPIAQKYALPLAARADEGMRAGRAFEQHVIGQMS